MTYMGKWRNPIHLVEQSGELFSRATAARDEPRDRSEAWRARAGVVVLVVQRRGVQGLGLWCWSFRGVACKE